MDKRLRRMTKYGMLKAWPDNLILQTLSDDIPKLEEGGIELILDALKEYPDIKVVIIDSYGAARSFAGSTSPYSFVEDYKFGQKLQFLSLRHNIGLIIIHHLNKGKHSHTPHRISGTVGVQSPADTFRSPVYHK